MLCVRCWFLLLYSKFLIVLFHVIIFGILIILNQFICQQGMWAVSLFCFTNILQLLRNQFIYAVFQYRRLHLLIFCHWIAGLYLAVWWLLLVLELSLLFQCHRLKWHCFRTLCWQFACQFHKPVVRWAEVCGYVSSSQKKDNLNSSVLSFSVLLLTV